MEKETSIIIKERIIISKGNQMQIISTTREGVYYDKKN